MTRCIHQAVRLLSSWRADIVDSGTTASQQPPQRLGRSLALHTLRACSWVSPNHPESPLGSPGYSSLMTTKNTHNTTTCSPTPSPDYLTWLRTIPRTEVGCRRRKKKRRRWGEEKREGVAKSSTPPCRSALLQSKVASGGGRLGRQTGGQTGRTLGAAAARTPALASKVRLSLLGARDGLSPTQRRPLLPASCQAARKSSLAPVARPA